MSILPRKPVPPRRPARAKAEGDPDDPAWKSIELAQRGRMILDVAEADLEAAESRLGSFHETTWFFRNALAEARRSWDRLRAEFGTAALEAAMAEPPFVSLTLGDNQPGRAPVVLVPIAGKTYRAERLEATDLAPILWRLARLPATGDDPIYAVRLRDGSIRCDCAQWIYQLGEADPPIPCKHLVALEALGWI